MNAQEFAYWLQGFFELNEAGTNEHKELSPAQVKMIREHLQLVFTKVTGEQVPDWLREPGTFRVTPYEYPVTEPMIPPNWQWTGPYHPQWPHDRQIICSGVASTGDDVKITYCASTGTSVQ